MLDQIEEMICFAAIIEKGSITNAATILKRSKAHISRKLNDLEARYKVKLFHRTTRKMNLTDAGKQLKHPALELYSQHLKLDHLAQQVQSNLTGDFAISVNDSIASFALKPIIPKLFNQFPDINFNINITNEPIDLIKENIDLTIRSGQVVDENLVVKKMGTMVEKLYMSTRNRALSKNIKNIADLQNHVLIVNPYTFKQGKIQLYNGHENIILNPKKLNIINRYKLILDTVLNSNHIGALLDFTTKKALDDGDIVNILPEWQLNEWPLYLVHPFYAPMPLKLKKISEFILENMQFSYKN